MKLTKPKEPERKKSFVEGQCPVCAVTTRLFQDKQRPEGFRLCWTCRTGVNRYRRGQFAIKDNDWIAWLERSRSWLQSYAGYMPGGQEDKHRERFKRLVEDRRIKPSQLVRLIELAGGSFDVEGRSVIPRLVPRIYRRAFEACAYQVEHYILDRVWSLERDKLPGSTEPDWPASRKVPASVPYRVIVAEELFPELKRLVREGPQHTQSPEQSKAKPRLCQPCGMKLTLQVLTAAGNWECRDCGHQVEPIGYPQYRSVIQDF